MDLTKYRAKLIGNEEERAVSPVIGVILMVAITVILAAVIAAFVLDMGDSIGQEANAAVDIEGDGTSSVEVSVTSLQSADGVKLAGGGIGEDTGDTYTYDDAYYTESVGTIGSYSSSDDSADEICHSSSGEQTIDVVAYLGESPDSTETETAQQSFTIDCE